jgi:putative tricarboxylic transport membrane protein
LALTIFWISRSFPKTTTGASDLTGPAFYPNVLALVFIFCGVLEIITGFRGREGNVILNFSGLLTGLRNPGVLNIFCIIALILFFIFFMEALGFIVTAYLIIFILMWRFGVPFVRNLAYSAAFVALLYLIFGKLFTIYLPSGILDYLEF